MFPYSLSVCVCVREQLYVKHISHKPVTVSAYSKDKIFPLSLFYSLHAHKSYTIVVVIVFFIVISCSQNKTKTVHTSTWDAVKTVKNGNMQKCVFFLSLFACIYGWLFSIRPSFTLHLHLLAWLNFSDYKKFGDNKIVQYNFIISLLPFVHAYKPTCSLCYLFRQFFPLKSSYEIRWQWQQAE